MPRTQGYVFFWKGGQKLPKASGSVPRAKVAASAKAKAAAAAAADQSPKEKEAAAKAKAAKAKAAAINNGKERAAKELLGNINLVKIEMLKHNEASKTDAKMTAWSQVFVDEFHNAEKELVAAKKVYSFLQNNESKVLQTP